MPGSAERMLRLSPTPADEPRVPVTAKLSKRFYGVLGEDVANELVDWFNAVDLTTAELHGAGQAEARQARAVLRLGSGARLRGFRISVIPSSCGCRYT